jgi:hypothetical protein
MADSSVGIAARLRAYSRAFGFRFPAEAKDFSVLYSVQMASGAQPAAYPIGNEVSSPPPGHKAAEA